MYSRPCCQKVTPRCEPIVMPVQERVCNRYHCVEQPIICPINTRIVHHYVPRPVYYPTYTQTEEVQGCPGATPVTGQPVTGTQPQMPNNTTTNPFMR